MRCWRQEYASQKTWRSAHTCPMCCDKIPPIFLTAPPSYAPIICHLRRCEKRLRDGKLATSSVLTGCKFQIPQDVVVKRAILILAWQGVRGCQSPPNWLR